MKYNYSDIRAIKAYLKRSFNEGVGSIMSLQGNYFTMPSTSPRCDAESLFEDWQSVGRDLKYAMRKVGK